MYYQWQHGEGQRARMALGICYPTDLAAYVAFLMFTYIGFRGFDIIDLELIVMLVLSGIVYYITDARTDVVCMLFAILLVFTVKIYLKKYTINLNNSIVKDIIIGLPFIICAGMITATVLFSSDNEIWNFIDVKFNSRLMFSKQAIEKYGITLNGQYVIEKGAGGSTESTDMYFFIDSSYISIVIKYGVVFVLLLCVMLSYDMYKFVENKNLVCMIMLFVICMHSVMEHHLIQYWYNPFVITFFTICNRKDDYIINKPRRGKVELNVEELE